MKVIVKVKDAMAVVRQFEAAPAQTMRELIRSVQQGVAEVLERVMDAEIELFLGEKSEASNKRNGYRARAWDTRVGRIDLEIPRLRRGSYGAPQHCRQCP